MAARLHQLPNSLTLVPNYYFPKEDLPAILGACLCCPPSEIITIRLHLDCHFRLIWLENACKGAIWTLELGNQLWHASPVPLPLPYSLPHLLPIFSGTPGHLQWHIHEMILGGCAYRGKAVGVEGWGNLQRDVSLQKTHIYFYLLLWFHIHLYSQRGRGSTMGTLL